MTFDANKGVSTFKGFIDASFGVHPDFWSHTDRLGRFGGGTGYPINVSAKKKSNTCSSTRTELATVGQMLPLVMWAPLFFDRTRTPNRDQ